MGGAALASFRTMTHIFGEFEFDEARWELRRKGAPVDAPPKVMQLLHALITHRDRVVTVEELFELVWPGVRVTEASITKAVRLARQILGDDPASQVYIKTSRGRGYRFVAEVSSARAVPGRVQDPGREPLHSGPRLLERSAELATLIGSFGRSRDGQGGLIVVSGEAGIGKTHLLQSFARLVEGAGGRTAWGIASQEGGAPELWPWIQILRTLIQSSVIDPDDPSAEEALRILPERMGGGASDPSGDGARFRRFDAVGRVLRSASRRAPLVLLLENLHCADSETLRLARFLAREIRDSAILIVGTHRPGEDIGEQAAGREASELTLDGRLLSLSRLDRDGTLELVQATLTGDVPAVLVDRIHQLTDGNPFFVTELSRWLATRPGSTLDETIELPRGIVEAVLERSRALPARTFEALSAGAVVGRTFELAVLARMLEIDAREAAQVLEPAVERRLVVPQTRTGAFAFFHGLARDVLYGEIETARRADLHRRAAEALEASAPPGAEPPAATLAHHHFRAALGGPSEVAARHCHAAGWHALRSLAADEARRHFNDALLVMRFGAGPADLRSDVMRGMGDAHRIGGDYARARGAYVDGMKIARGIPDAVRLARAALGFAQVKPEYGAPNDEVIRVLEESVSALEELGSGAPGEVQEVLAQVLSRLATCQAIAGNAPLGDALSDRALTIARGLGHPLTLAHALVARHWALWRPGTVKTRLSMAEEIIGLDRATRDPSLTLQGRVAQINDLLELGHPDAFGRCLPEYERLAIQSRDPAAAFSARVYRTAQSLMEGRFDDADRQAAETLVLGAAIHEESATTFHAAQLWWARLEQGRGEEIESLSGEVVNGKPDDRGARGALLRLHAELGNEVEARHQLELLCPPGSGVADPSWLLLATLAHAAMACRLLRDGERALRIREQLLPFEAAHVVIGPGIVYLGPVSFYMAACEDAIGRLADCIHHLEAARRATLRMVAPALTTRIEVHIAEALAARGGPGDRRAARRLAEQAESAARNMGMRTLVKRARAIADSVGESSRPIAS